MAEAARRPASDWRIAFGGAVTLVLAAYLAAAFVYARQFAEARLQIGLPQLPAPTELLLSFFWFGQQNWIVLAVLWLAVIVLIALGVLDRIAKAGAIVFAVALVLWALAVYVAIVVPLSRLQVH